MGIGAGYLRLAYCRPWMHDGVLEKHPFFVPKCSVGHTYTLPTQAPAPKVSEDNQPEIFGKKAYCDGAECRLPTHRRARTTGRLLAAIGDIPAEAKGKKVARGYQRT